MVGLSGTVLVVNSGSSSLKLRVVDATDAVRHAADLPAVSALGDDDLRDAVAAAGPFDAVGHRVVHGGAHREPVRIDDGVRRALADAVTFAPQHQPSTLRALDLVSAATPGTPAVAVFDTGFHTTIPSAATTYAIPRAWRERFGIRKVGFHGLAHSWVSRRVSTMLGGGSHRVITCHLGSGASVAAVVDGRCVDTTMGFTPLDGLVMAHRSGSVDPGAILWLAQVAGVPVSDIANGLEQDGGLQGLAGTSDMATVVERAGLGDAAAALALDVYVHRLRGAVAAMVAAAGGVDAIAFSGGVGEHSAEVRRRTCAGLSFLGVLLDPDANGRVAGDAEIGRRDAPVRCFVVRAREDLEVAAATRAVLNP